MPPKLELLFTLKGKVGAPLEVGATPSGTRRIFQITEGDFDGPRLRGRLLPGGTDHMLVRADGVVLPDASMTLQTDDGVLIFLSYTGFRHGSPSVMKRLAGGDPVDPSEYYFRITAHFETASKKYDWLNRIVAIGTGDRRPEGPVYEIFEVL